MKLLDIDLTSGIIAASDTTNVVQIKEVVEKYAGMTADEILMSLLSKLLAFGLKFVGALVVFFVGRWLMNRFCNFIIKLLTRRHVEPSVQSFLRSLINITLMLVLVVMVIGIFGINTTSFVALFASAGVAISMALSGSLQNFAGGLMILVFKPYKVGDFIQTWLMGSWNCGVFTHREIAQRLMDTFTGLKVKELAWFENPREKTLKNGKPRVRRAKWLPEREVDLVYLYSDHYLDARNPTPAETDFFTVTRMDAWGVSTWFMCTPEAAGKLIAMDYDNLAVKETTIVG